MSAAVYDTLRAVTTATITTMLLKKGIRRCWMHGPKPLVADGARLVGPAFTLRFVPVREDLATPESWSKPISTRGAIEAMPEGCIAVADAMGIASAGIFGDILTMRMMKRGVTALVTDGGDAALHQDIAENGACPGRRRCPWLGDRDAPSGHPASGRDRLRPAFRRRHTGTKRSVNAGPTRRAPSATSGFAPFIQQRRMLFFGGIVVMVAVVIARSVS